VYQDEQVTAFHDTRPAAPVHILVIPNRHIASVNDLTEADEPLMGRLFTIAKQIAQEQGIAESGYRLILNTGPHAGQAVFHIHLHILGGQRMRHPMG
jgi:histidine triad (HIT) family protein